MPPVTTTPPEDPNALTLAKPKPLTQATAQSPLTLAPAQAANSIPAATVQAPTQPVDRVALATQAFDTFQQARAPQDQRNLEAVTSQAAGMGQLGSGQWRTALTNQNNERQLQLDTQRDSLINKATEGSVADASTAFQQALAGSQQGLATELGRAGVENQKGSLSLAEKSLTQSGSQFDKSLAQSGTQFDQSLALQSEAQKIDAAYKAGTMTLAQKDQALRELENKQQYGLAGQQLELAKTGQTADIENQKQQLALAKSGQTIQQDQFTKSLAEQAAARLQSGSQFDKSLAQSGEQFRASLAQNATQFGLSQDQQMALAKLSDATANRSIDASTEQGKNQLLIQLAQIIGGPTGTLNPEVLAAIAKMFGVTVAPTTNVTQPPPPPRPRTRADGTPIEPGDPDYEETRIPGAP